MQTINDLEVSAQAAFEAMRKLKLNPDAEAARELLLPDGLSPVVELVSENWRRKRGNAASWNWNPQTDRIVISFRAIDTANGAPPTVTTESPSHEKRPDDPVETKNARLEIAPIHRQDEVVPDSVTPQEVVECCQALASAERSNRQFIALTWFRDDFLTTVDFAWAKSSQRRQRVLSEAINIGRIDAKKIPNPRSNFPTTTISLNRSVPTPGVAPRFQPVAVRGEAVSTTLLRDRGSF
jgi:hypothetical protein